MNLLFFGELPPKSIHGVSLSNSVNINILISKFKIDIIEESIDLIEYGKFSAAKYFSFLSYCKQLIVLSLKTKYDFFYSTYSLSLIGSVKTFLPIILFKLFNRKGKVVTHIHRGDFDIFFNKNQFTKTISTLVLKMAYKVVFLSDKFIYAKLPYSIKFNVLPNTIIYPENIAFSYNSDNYIYISNYIKEKGIFELLHAFNSIDNKQLQLNCYGQFTSNTIKDKILLYANQTIKINNVIADESLKYSLLSSSTCLILPSYNEGQPLIILEAMCIGLPIIATKVGDIPNMLGSNYPLLIESESVSALKQAIETMQSMNICERKKLSDYLRNRFNECFSFKKHESLLLSIFE